MSIKSFPFTSINGDRKMTAADFRSYWYAFATNGIVYGQLDACRYSKSGMDITIHTGIAHINGAIAVVDSAEAITITAASIARYATIVLEYNNNSDCRDIHIAVVYGSSNAEGTLIQTDTVWQLPICSMFVPANATTLADVMITDKRQYLKLRAAAVAGGSSSNRIIYLTEIAHTSIGSLLGDVNSDKNIDNLDVVALANWITGIGTIDTEAAELNGDGTVNNADLELLTAFLVNMPYHWYIIQLMAQYDDGTTGLIYKFVEHLPVTPDELEEIKHSSEEIGTISKLVVPVSLHNKIINGYGVNAQTGNIYRSDHFSVTDYIDISDVNAIRYTKLCVPVVPTVDNPIRHGMAFYDEAETYISGIVDEGNAESTCYKVVDIPVPEGARYARFTLIDTLDGFCVLDKNQYVNSLQVAFPKLEKAVDDLMLNIMPRTLPFELIDGYYINAKSGEVWKSEYFSVTGYIDISDVNAIRYIRMMVAPESPNHGMAFYDAAMTYISGVLSVGGAPESTNMIYDVNVPAGARFARFSYWAESGRSRFGDFAVYDLHQVEMTLQSQIQDIRNNMAGITHTVPPTPGHLNVIRRCRMYTDIKWTPAVDIPRRSQMAGETVGDTSPVFEDVFRAGTEYTGIPYARADRQAAAWGYADLKVGTTVDFETFISAVSSSESVVAKASIYDAARHNACAYAVNCAAMASYAFGLNRYYTAVQLPSVSGMTQIGYVGSIDIKDIMLCDMLDDPTAHVAIVTDIVTNDDGTVTHVEISEATTIGNDNWNVIGSQFGGLCRRKMWPISDFLIKWNGYGVYRYGKIENVPYTKNPYVDTGNEGDALRVVNFPCLPYMGENFHYKAGYIPNARILTPAYRDGETTKLCVLKDGVPWNANGSTDYYDVDNAQYVDVGFAEPGTYSAYLCKVDNDGKEIIKTRSCHWTVI